MIVPLKNPLPFLTTAVFAGLLTGPVGCKKNSTPEALALEQVPAVMQQAFTEAKPEIKNQAGQATAALKQDGDAVRALGQLQVLITQPELTPEQRAAATRALRAVQQNLQNAATKGDARATQALQNYGSKR